MTDGAFARAAWWAPIYEASNVAATLGGFWERVATVADRLRRLV